MSPANDPTYNELGELIRPNNADGWPYDPVPVTNQIHANLAHIRSRLLATGMPPEEVDAFMQSCVDEQGELLIASIEANKSTQPQPAPGSKPAYPFFSKTIAATSYRDLSTIMCVPSVSPTACDDQHHAGEERDGQRACLHGIPESVAWSWLSLMTPANHKFTRINVSGAEVGDAYNQMISVILADPELSTWRYVLTVETDNLPPPTGLLQLLADIEDVEAGGPFDAISGLYYVKGEGGPPLCYGKPGELPKNFRPFEPEPETITPVNGFGMGFTLFRLDLFKRMGPPWFRTVQEWIPGVGERMGTQDLDFCSNAARFGARFAVSSKVRVGHLDTATGRVW